jgi:hypothetical protein
MKMGSSHRVGHRPSREVARQTQSDQAKIAACQVELKSKGWTSSVIVRFDNGKPLYVVASNQSEEWIFGKGDTEMEAWQDAVQKASDQR